MRIRCFSEARGVFEEGQISFEPQIHCFGGGGGGGGNSAEDQAIAEQEAYDAAGGSPSQNFSSGRGGGDSRSEADRSYEDDFGFSSDLADKYSGSAADVGGNDNDSSRQAIAARAGVPTDTIVGSGPQGSGVVTSAGGPVTSARSVAQAAGDLGISDDEVRARINAAASAAPGPSAAAAFDQAIAEQEAYDAAFNIFDTPEFQDMQSRLAEQQAAAERDRILGIASSAMTQDDVYNMFGGPGPVSSVEMQNRILGGSGGSSTRPSVTDPNRSILSIGGREYSFDNTVPADQRSYTEISGPSIGGVTGALDALDALDATPVSMAPVFSAPAPRPSANRFEGEVVPGFGASIDRAIGDFMGETYGGRTEQLPDGTINKELFTDLGDFVSRRDRNPRNPGNIGVGSGAALGATSNRNFQSADFLSGYSPVDQQRMQEGYLADYGLEIPILAGVNAIANPEYTMTQALRQGATPVYGTLPGQEGSILGATSPSGDIVYSNAPFGDSLAAIKGTFGSGPGLDPNMEAAYARQRELDDAERERRDSGGDQAAPPALTLPDPVTQECPEGYTRDGSGICVYEGQPRVGVTPYTPMAPVEFSYTGLPSLAPRTLTPTAPNLSFLNRR